MCCSCGGADSRARHCTGETNGPSLKWQMPPNCHCEERSDVAISGRHSQSVQAAVKTYRPIASVAALTERLVQGYSTAQGHWCTARHPDVSLRGAKRRGNLGKALPIYTECRRTQSPPNLTAAALVAQGRRARENVAALTAQPLAALPPYGCGVPLAGCERPVGAYSTAQGHWCTAEPP